VVKDIWEPGTEAAPNPFLEVYTNMNERYIKEIKAPLASIIIAPIKRGRDMFCTIELGRYREGEPSALLAQIFELGSCANGSPERE
jgi:hypothetical protein